MRLRILPFLARFTTRDEEVDEARHVYKAMDQATMEATQKREAPYILSWVLRCARLFYSDPFLRPPPIVTSYTQKYFEDQDDVGKFLRAKCVEQPEAKTQAKDLYAAFRKYCMEELGTHEKYVLSQKAFGPQLALRYEKVSSNVVYYKGIRLLRDGETKPEHDGEDLSDG